jgi:hypothetical protein
MMAATGLQSTLADVNTPTTFSTEVKVEGRDTPFSTRQLELISSEFEALFNAISDDATLSFVRTDNMESDADDNRELRKRRRLRRYLYLTGQVYCAGCNRRKPQSDRLLGASDTDIDVNELMMKKFGKGLQEIFDGITSVELI